MVKSYARYEHEACFGVITSSPCNIVYTSNNKALTAGLEEILYWNLKTGELLQKLRDDSFSNEGGIIGSATYSKTLSRPAIVTQLAYHDQSNLIAAGYSDGRIKIWDLSSSSVLMVFSGHKSGITKLVFDRSGTRLCSGSNDTDIIMWDLVGETGLFKLRGHKDLITGLQLVSENNSPENIDELEDWLISISKDGIIKLWDLKSKISIESHVAHSGECWSLDFDWNSKFLITTGLENQLKLWKVDLTQDETKLIEQGIYLKTSNAKAVNIEFLRINENLLLFLVQNSDKTIEIFRFRSAEEITKALTKKEKKLRESGNLLDEEIQLQLEKGKINMNIHPVTVVRSLSKIKTCTWASSNYKNLELILTTINNSIETYSIALPSELKKISITNNDIQSNLKYIVDLLGHRNDIRTMDISHDDKLLATASNGQLKIWNLKTKNCLRTIQCGYALCCKFLPGDGLIVIGTRQGSLQLFELSSSELVYEIEDAHNNSIWSIDISDDGKNLITGSADKFLKIWTFEIVEDYVTATQKVPKMTIQLSKAMELEEDILCVKLSPADFQSGKNKYLAVSLLDNTVKIFHFETLKFYLSLYGHKLPVLSVDISFDSKLIITSSADKNIKIWGLDFGDCHKSIFAHQDSIMTVKFIPNSHNFFSGSKDSSLKYWDGDKFENIQKLNAHQSEVWNIAVSQIGEFVISTSHDHSIRIWRQTDDEVFVEEEKEKEMDELYEQTLLESYDDGANDNNVEGDDEQTEEVGKVTKQTIESLKDGEKLMEALDIGLADLNRTKEDNRNIILLSKNISAEEYVLEVVSSIKPSNLEDAILILSYAYSLKLLTFIDLWCKNKERLLLSKNLSLISRLMFFIIQIHHRQIISSRDPTIKNQLVNVKYQLRSKMSATNDTLGFNLQALKFIKSQWLMTHSTEFVDEYDQMKSEEKFAKKRVFEQQS